MLKFISKFLVIFLMFLLVGCAIGDADTAWEKVNAGAMLVDVRSMDEYDQGHVPGAKLIPHDQVEMRLAEFGTDKSAPIVLYCKRGVRADVAMDVLKKNGFLDVTNGGGYFDMMDSMPK